MGKYDSAEKIRKTEGRDPCIANLEEIEPESYERKGIGGTSWDLGQATGTRLIGIDVTEIPPGTKSSHLHSHSQKEEFFYVLTGRCKVKLGSAEHELRQGDAVSRPAGTGVPHQFHNPYAEPCRVLMIGVQAGKGVEDVVDWPELGRTLKIDSEGARMIEKKAK
jgi:uncharacterized cupin superfamily protein